MERRIRRALEVHIRISLIHFCAHDGPIKVAIWIATGFLIISFVAKIGAHILGVQ